MLESLVSVKNLDEADFIPSDDEDENDNDSDIPFPITAFQASPRLKKLTTSFLEFTHHLTTDGTVFHPNVLPWPKFTHLHIAEFVHVKIFVAALTECVGLQFLHVSLSMEGVEDSNNATLASSLAWVILPELTATFISIDDGSSFPSEMDIFSFPALVDFHIRRIREDTGEKDVFSWTRSLPLRLTGHVGSVDQIIVLLTSIPTLAQLSLNIFIDYQTLLPPPTFAHPYSTSKIWNSTYSLDRWVSLADLQISLFETTKEPFLAVTYITYPMIRYNHAFSGSLNPRPSRTTSGLYRCLSIKDLLVIRFSASFGDSFTHRFYELISRVMMIC